MFFSNEKKSIVPGYKPTDITLPEPYRSYATYVSLYQIHLETLRKESSFLCEKIEDISKVHYEFILSTPNLTKIVNAHSTVERLKISFKKYLESLFSGQVDMQYVRYREKIGIIHYNINLGPEWYLGSQIRILDVLSAHIMDKIKNRKRVTACIEALNRILIFDSQIILKEYSEMFKYKTNEGLCDAVDRSSHSENIESVIRTKEKIIEVVELLENIKVEFLDSQKKTEVMKKDFSTLVESTNQSIKEIQLNKEGISKTILNIEDFSFSYSKLVENWVKLNKEIEKIKNVIVIIEDIAERTNLLSLNASIEAARAGREGAGFAVVSSEINKLSMQTTESVQSITSIVKSLVNELKLIDQETKNYGFKLGENVTQAMGSIKELENIIQYTLDSSQRLTTFYERFDRVYEEYSEQNQRILDIIEIKNDLVKDIEYNAGLLFSFTEKINNLRKENMIKMGEVPLSVMIRTVKTEHLLWKWFLVSFMFGLYQLPEEQVVDHTQCRLGNWYYSMKNSPISRLPSFGKIELPHIELHKHAKSIYQHIKNENLGMARQEIRELEKNSKEIVKLLDQLEIELQSNSN